MTVNQAVDDRMPSLCREYDRLTQQIEEMLVAPSCPPDMREMVEKRQAVKAGIEKLARSCMDEISEAGAAHSLLYFNTWLSLRGGFGKD